MNFVSISCFVTGQKNETKLKTQISSRNILKGPLDSCLERYIGLGFSVGLGFVGQRGVSEGEDTGIKFCEQPNNWHPISSRFCLRSTTTIESDKIQITEHEILPVLYFLLSTTRNDLSDSTRTVINVVATKKNTKKSRSFLY